MKLSWTSGISCYTEFGLQVPLLLKLNRPPSSVRNFLLQEHWDRFKIFQVILSLAHCTNRWSSECFKDSELFAFVSINPLYIKLSYSRWDFLKQAAQNLPKQITFSSDISTYICWKFLSVYKFIKKYNFTLCII